MASVTVTTTGTPESSRKLRTEYMVHNPIFLLARATGAGFWYTRCRNQAMLSLFRRADRSELEIDLASGLVRALDATSMAFVDAFLTEQQEGQHE